MTARPPPDTPISLTQAGMRVLVCGGRRFQNYLRFARVMNELRSEFGPFAAIIHGGACGADWCAHLWANSPIGHIPEIEFKADRTKYGKAAGPIRNRRMIQEGRPDLVIAFPGGDGTADCVKQARAAGITVIEIASSHHADTPISEREVLG